MIYEEQTLTNKANDELAQGRTGLGWTRSGDKGCVYHCADRMLQGLLSSELQELRHTILKIPYLTRSGIVFDKCHKNCDKACIDAHSISF